MVLTRHSDFARPYVTHIARTGIYYEEGCTQPLVWEGVRDDCVEEMAELVTGRTYDLTLQQARSPLLWFPYYVSDRLDRPISTGYEATTSHYYSHVLNGVPPHLRVKTAPQSIVTSDTRSVVLAVAYTYIDKGLKPPCY